MQITKFIFSILLIFLPCAAFCQELEETQENSLANMITYFFDEYEQLGNNPDLEIHISEANIASESYTRLLGKRLGALSNDLQTLDFRWNAFTQAEQTDIASNEFLMSLMARVQEVRQMASDTIAVQQDRCNALIDFSKAERLIQSQDTVYKKLYRKAQRLTIVKQTAPQLEKIKAEEHSHFEKLQSSYDKAKAAAQLIPQLTKRAAQMDERFYTLKALSTKIQSMEYKSPIERAKDYLMGVAYVAVILIFINMVTTKLQAAKKAREMLKKQKDLLNKNNNEDYPTI